LASRVGGIGYWVGGAESISLERRLEGMVDKIMSRRCVICEDSIKWSCHEEREYIQISEAIT